MRAFLYRLLHLFRRSRHDADLREEMETHRSLRQDKLERDGVAPVDAVAASRRAFGNATLAREDAREVWVGPAIEGLWQDVRGAARSLRQRPAFAAAVIATLGLGIGGSTAIFSVVDAVLLRPLPYHEPDRLVRIWESNPAEASDRRLVSAAIFNDWRARSHTLDDIALFNQSADPTVVGIGNDSLQLRHAVVTPNLFAVMGVRPAIGRHFAAVAERRGPLEAREVIVSDALWQRAFGGGTDVEGQTVRLEGLAGNVVVGVMPVGFSFPEGTDVWTATRPVSNRYDWREYGAIGRLSDGATVAAAELELRRFAATVAEEHPDGSAPWSVVVVPLHDSVVGTHRLALVTLFAAVAFVVLVACANVSNLVLTRGLARRGELAVRAAIGATRARITRLLIAETVVLAGIGGAAGCLVAGLLLPVLIQLAGPHVPRLTEARVDGAAFAFAAVATIVAAIVAGVAPAIRASRTDPRFATRAESDRVTWSRSNIRIQRAIVAVQLAACLVLLVGATLFAQTFMRLSAVDLGFDPAHVLTVEARVPIYRTLAPDRWQRLASDTTEALRRLRTLPGVQAASTASDLPLAGNLLPTEVTPADDERTRQAFYHRVSPDYFRTMGMTLVAGRDFTNEDIGDLARLPAIPDPRTAVPREGAVIVNETLARVLWPESDALGQFLSTSFDTRLTNRRHVVGIVRDARSNTPRHDAPPEVYVPYLEDPGFVMTLLVRTTVPADRVAAAIRHELRAVSPDLSMASIRMLDDVVDQSMLSSRFSALVVGTFAAAALLLSALGVFGVFAFGAAARVREVGIRMALGATASDITRLFLAQALAPIGAGVVLGTVGALVLGRLVQALLFGVEATDGASYVTAVSTLVIVALAASYLPVRRMLRTDPARGLRGQASGRG